MKYPATTKGFLRPTRSETQPVTSFTELEAASATPSIAPSVTGGAPIAARKEGSAAVAVSCPRSERKLVTASAQTFRLSQRSRGAAAVEPAAAAAAIESFGVTRRSPPSAPGDGRAARACGRSPRWPDGGRG